MNPQLKILDLSGLSETERNSNVNAALSETIGWKREYTFISQESPTAGQEIQAWVSPSGKTSISELPPYATSADAVLPLLKTYWEVNAGTLGDGHAQVTVEFWGAPKDQHGEGAAPTFPLAACFALLRSHGWTITT